MVARMALLARSASSREAVRFTPPRDMARTAAGIGGRAAAGQRDAPCWAGGEQEVQEELEVEVPEKSGSPVGDTGLDRTACEHGLAGHDGPHLSFPEQVGFEGSC